MAQPDFIQSLSPSGTSGRCHSTALDAFTTSVWPLIEGAAVVDVARWANEFLQHPSVWWTS